MDLIKNLFKGDKVIWIIYFVLCMISIIEVFSASSTLTYKSGDHWRPITMHIVLLTVGTIIVLIVHNIPCKRFKLFAGLLPFSWLALIGVLINGALTNGAKRWIDLGFFQFQPSEVAKMCTLISVAYILSKAQEEGNANPKAFKQILIVTGITIMLIISENLSTALLLASSVFLLMFVGRIPLKQMLMLTVAGISFLVVAFATIKFIPTSAWDAVGLDRMSTWQNRINDHFKKEDVPAAKFDINNDAQVAHANIAIASSNIIGKGPGNSVQRDFLSQAFSDFIYAIIIEEMGLIGGAVVVILYLLLLIRVAKIARNCDRSYYVFLITGFAILISLQAMFNMLVAVGIIPVTGQPLPLISKGGTSTLVNCVYIGIILSISRHVNELKKKEQEEEAQKQLEIQQAAEQIIKYAQDMATSSNSISKDKN